MIKAAIIPFSLLLALLPAAVFAQAPDTLWTRSFGGQGYDEAWQLKQTLDGGFIIIGYRELQLPDGSDIYLIKTDENGDTLWTRIYDYSIDGVGRSVEPLDDGGYVITGHAENKCILIKTDSLGNELWQTYLTAVYGRAVRVTADGGFVIAGYKTIPGNTYDMYIAKTDNSGDLLWSRTYGGTYAEMAWDVRETPDGGFAVVGWTTLSNGYADIYLVRTDANGDSIWSKTYGGTRNNEGRSILVKDDGGFIIAGKISNAKAIISTDQNGDTLWTRAYPQNIVSIANSISSTSDGGLILTAVNIDSSITSSAVIKMNSDGDLLWSASLEDSEQSLYCRSIVQSADGGYVVAGYHQVPSNFNDVFLVKLDSDVTGIEEESSLLPARITLHQNFPNPFNASTTISFALSEQGDITLSIYDLLGRRISVLANDYYEAGKHDITLNAGDLTSGIYFYNLKAGEVYETKSMILLK